MNKKRQRRMNYLMNIILCLVALVSLTVCIFLLLKNYQLNFETTAELSDILSRIGLENVFSDDADFSGIADKAVHVSSVLQKTKLELDENGTKAAAVTAVTMECMSAMDTDPIIKAVELTRPFAFLIYDSANEEVLFMGKVTTVTE